MSIHGECFDNGDSGRCNLQQCSKFWRGECPDPEEIAEPDELKKLDDEAITEIYKRYPRLTEGNSNKEHYMETKLETGIRVQQNDRTSAAKKLMTSTDRLNNGRATNNGEGELFTEESVEIFRETIDVPVNVTCVETGGKRQVYLNAFKADGTKFNVLASRELIACFANLSKKVAEIDAGLGCENLNKAVDTLL